MTKDEKQTDVAIIMPSLNGAKYLEKALASILAMRDIPYRLYVADGGSTDGTVEILEKFKAEHGDRLIYVSEKDGSGGEAFNKMYARVSSRFVTWFSTDDILIPDEYQKMYRVISEDDTIDYIYGDTYIVRETEEKKNEALAEDIVDPFFWVKSFQGLPFESSIIRRSALDTLGYREGHVICDTMEIDGVEIKTTDYEMWIRMLLKGCTFKRYKGFVSNHRSWIGASSFENSAEHYRNINLIRKFYMKKLGIAYFEMENYDRPKILVDSYLWRKSQIRQGDTAPQ